jgi:hypothetical protein
MGSATCATVVQKRQVPAQVFGFPVTQNDRAAWAEAHNIVPGEYIDYRRRAAWNTIGVKLPPNCRRITIIRNPMETYCQSMCFVVATNLSAKDMEPAQDSELIESLYQIIDMGKRPGWFRISRG